MSSVQVELYKGDEEVSDPLTIDNDLNVTQAVMGTQLVFDKDQADKVTLYVTSDDGDLLGIITKSKGEFDTKEVAVEVNQLLNGE